MGQGSTKDEVATPNQVSRVARPEVPAHGTLERRLAVSTIVAASGTGRRPTLGRFEVQSRIGGGAMGVVYRARDPELQRIIAVKLLRGWTESGHRLQIVDEARRLAQLTHPNIVAVYDIVDDDDGLYFIMEYVAGTTLGGWLQAHPGADFRETLDWFVQAGRGLCAAHDADMVHRDFKPDNVLVGEDGRVRVADFGLAAVLRELPDHPPAGTPYYMAPELGDGSPASPASDQYAYCVALRDALVEDPAVPAEVRHAIDKGLSDRPAERHPSLATLVDLLARALEPGGDQRPRALLLDRLERLWLRGVLERSLGPAGSVDLRLESRPELVEPPWGEWGAASGGPSGEDSGQRLSIPGERTTSRRLALHLRESHGALLLLGSPGCGKTTLLLQLCRELWRTASLNSSAPAPAVLSLSTYRPRMQSDDPEQRAESFQAWLVDELVVKYGLPRPTVRRWFDEGGIVLLLDGLDEADAATRKCLVKTLNDFRARQPLSMVVACRDSEYESIGARLAFGTAVAVQPLDDEAMTTLLEGRDGGQLIERLGHDEELRELLRNPLLLTLYATTDGHIDAQDSTPEARGWSHAYAGYVERAFEHVDPGERIVLSKQLSWLADAMRRNNTSDLWLERLHFGWLNGAMAQRLAYVTGVLLVGVFGLGLNLAQVPFTSRPLSSAMVFGLGVWICSFAYTRGRLIPVESLRWSLSRARRLLPITAVCVTSIGLIEAMKVNFAAKATGAAFVGAFLTVLFALEPGERAAKVRPNVGIHQSLINALLTSFGSGIPVGLLFALLIQPYILRPLTVVPEYTGEPHIIVGVALGIFVFTAMFLIYGGFTAIMHYVLRLWIAVRTPLPLDMSRVLDRASDLGLLRRVGGGYVFLHRTLLDYFADAYAATEPPSRLESRDTVRPPRDGSP